MSRLVLRWVLLLLAASGLVATSACTTPASIALGAVGVASDHSMGWEIVKHLHAKLTEGDPAPCLTLDPVERALSPRCGEFVPGSLKPADLAASPFGACALATAAGDARLWPALPGLLAVGARPETCAQPALVALAQATECPDLAAASPEVRGAFVTLAHTDPRSVQHDVVRWLSCPASRAAGLGGVLDDWLASGALNPGSLSFSPLAALDPSAIGTPLSAALEAHGHTAQAALGGYVGQRNTGFEEALRTSNWVALDWWFDRVPRLANRAPGPQLDWLPLARVLTPGFLAAPESRAGMVGFLIAHGADPRARLPSDPAQTVIGLARTLNSPQLAMLDAAPPGLEPVHLVASNTRALRLIGP
ncbi:MAG TPA: hypothetical protein VGM74_09785 [Burkholderiaceae bacterium]|jgi:hypothetical protein